MQPLVDNIDELLEKWETLKDAPIPLPCTLNEALEFTRLKISLTALSRRIRNNRLKNNYSSDDLCSLQFCEEYNTFNKEYVYRILKSD